MGEPARGVRDAARPPVDTNTHDRPFWAIVMVGLAVLAVAGPYKMATQEHGGYSANSVVHMAGLRFSPAVLVVASGSTVYFSNDDVAPHTVTARDGSINSGTLKPGTGTFQLNVGGRLEYICTIHPSMSGKIEISG
jgi:plastocyanin